ncbi:MAG TPA: molybdenum cofactor biosynthesis protein MoaE [Vicinamibacterales bacterium]|jgi:molybdopterin synthase catalytic subunit
MPCPLLAIGAIPLDAGMLAAAVQAAARTADASDGAVATFVGLVRDRNLGRTVQYLVYEAYEPLAIRSFERIAAEAAERWASARLGIHHRIGRLEIGEASIAIASASPHRGEAFAACRYAIERVKQIAPIWKKEYFDTGDVWIEGAVADPQDAAARQEALRRACA